METDLTKKAAGFFDGEGRLKSFPAKRPLRILVLSKVAEGFAGGRDYTEKEVNAVIRERIAFSDVELVRRELYEAQLIGRLPDGSKYWKNKAE
ncbi:MAG: DUF2087 domain-containing protein [Clostridia bacterium]|nr:DUF2087 domain-containing protein [Clostridia bacterium]